MRKYLPASGYDRVSGLPKSGTDTMEFVADAMGPLTPGFYHYAGERRLSIGIARSISPAMDTASSFKLDAGRVRLIAPNRLGFRSRNCGYGVASSGGFEQLRFAISRRFFALARYEGTNETLPGTFSRDGVLLLGYAPVAQ